ncbi:MAG: hypothetical protein ABI726_04290 [bacterium]
MILAHFTPTEVPGTLAVLCLGLCFGVLIARHRSATPLMTMVACSLIAFAALGYFGDARGWPESARISIDVIFLVQAILLASLAIKRA